MAFAGICIGQRELDIRKLFPGFVNLCERQISTDRIFRYFNFVKCRYTRIHTRCDLPDIYVWIQHIPCRCACFLNCDGSFRKCGCTEKNIKFITGYKPLLVITKSNFSCLVRLKNPASVKWYTRCSRIRIHLDTLIILDCILRSNNRLRHLVFLC